MAEHTAVKDVSKEKEPAAGSEKKLSPDLPNVQSQSPSFRTWRDAAGDSKKPSSDVEHLKSLLIQKQRIVNSSDMRGLPDGGQRLIDQINNLKLEIKQKERKLNPEAPPFLPAKDYKAVSSNIIWAAPPTKDNHRMEEPDKTNSKKENLVVPGSKPIVWAGPPSEDKPRQAYQVMPGSKPIVWAGPPSDDKLRQAYSGGPTFKPYSNRDPYKHQFKPQMHTAAAASNKTIHSYFQKHNPGQDWNGGKVDGGGGNHGQVVNPNARYSSSISSNFKTYGKAGNSFMQYRQTLPIQPHSYQKFQGLWSDKGQQHSYYGGRMTKTRIAQVKSVTEDAVIKLHNSLDGCPGPEVQAVEPAQLAISLMPHQRQALAWMMWREEHDPPGGILADDMGLGKTLTLISLVLKKKQLLKEDVKQECLPAKGLVKSQATLVVCPASLMLQWEKEINVRCDKDALKVLVYHGPKREKDIEKIASYDVVLTTYAILSKEVGDCKEEKEEIEDNDMSMSPVLQRIVWERIILDEAHQIKNTKAKCCNAVCLLRATYRWALTGTPIHNDLLDMYALIRFLRVSPFDELKVWKKWVGNRTAQGQERLSTLIKSLLLRRTKDQLDSSGKPLVRLPTKSSTMHEISLSEKERTVYDEIDKHFKSTLNNMISSKAGDDSKKGGSRGSQAVLFTLLLRLQQSCNHLCLLHKAAKDSADEDADDLAKQLESINLEEKKVDKPVPLANEDILSFAKYKGEKEFEASAESSKVATLLKELKEILRAKDKSVIVSQWTSMLKVVASHLKHMGIAYALIQGDVPVKSRMDCINNFNNMSSDIQVMLLSLKAGGVGLNLTGGNHLFLLDVHWNPALESQASDRIFRVGQTKDVTIHRFICKDTVEEKILKLQSHKLELARSVLRGDEKAKSGLTLEDLKQLFCVK